MEITHNGPGTTLGPAETFTGQVWMDKVAMADDEAQRLHVLKVHFTPGARSAWHSHPVGQVLYVLDGIGRVQDRNGPLREIRGGDSVITAPGVWHWHGAAPGFSMTHLAIQQPDPDGVEANWGEPVDDGSYRADPAKP
jgi:quercetin dioxygenase-like cupin family protein